MRAGYLYTHFTCRCCTGFWAEELELRSDAEVADTMVKELQTIFPELSIPPVTTIKRTKWRLDPFARGSYSTPRVGADPLGPSYLAQPVADRLLWAGEATSILRHGYVDGAYETGLREAQRVIGMGEAPAFSPGSDAKWRAPRPSNDRQLRNEWHEAVEKYVL